MDMESDMCEDDMGMPTEGITLLHPLPLRSNAGSSSGIQVSA